MQLPGLKAINLDLCSGQILGLAGVSGNGQAAIADLVSGLGVPASGGSFSCMASMLNGHPAPPSVPGSPAFPKTSHKTGTIADFNLTENAVLEGYFRPDWSAGWMDWKAWKSWPRISSPNMMYAAPAPSPASGLFPAATCKSSFLAACWSRSPDIIIANQPVRGLDVGAIAYVHSRLIAARDAGAAVC